MKPLFTLPALLLITFYLAPYEPPAAEQVVDYTISGSVLTGDGLPLADVPMGLSGAQTGATMTAADGAYSFPNLPEGFSYTVTPTAPAGTNPLDGLSEYDLILIRKAILSIEPLQNPCQTLAADVNGNAVPPIANPLNGVSSFDMVLISNVLLGNLTSFTPGWEFLPAGNNTYGPAAIPSGITVPNLTGNTQANFIAIRAGDVSGCLSDPPLIPPFLAVTADANLVESPGASVSVPVVVEGFNNVMGLQFTIRWDPAVLSFAGFNNLNGSLPGLANSNFGNTNTAGGELRFLWFNSNIAGSNLPDGAALFNLNFTAIGPAGSSSAVEVSSGPLPGEVVNAQEELSEPIRRNGLVTISAANQGSIFGNISRNSGAPVGGIDVNLSGGATGLQLTNNSGNYAFANLTEGLGYTVTPSVAGDCASPCHSVYDLFLILQHILGIAPLSSPYAIISADVNDSQSVTTFDAVQLQSLMLGNTNTLPDNACWRFVDELYNFPSQSNPFQNTFPESVTINNLQGNREVNIIGIQVGDVSDCAETLSPGSLALELDITGQDCPGEEVLVNVQVQQGFTDLLGLQFSLNWDPAVLSYNGVQNFGLPNMAAASFGQPAPGELNMIWLAPGLSGVTLPDGSVLFQLSLTINGPVGAASPIAFAASPLSPQAVDGTGQPVTVATQDGLFTVGANTPLSLGCNSDIVVSLNGDCQFNLLPNQVLEGSLGCFTESDFVITVQDGNTANGPVVDGVGVWPYEVGLAPGAAADGYDDFTSCFGFVEGVDNQPPTIGCPANVVETAASGQPGATATWPGPSVSDNCSTTLSGSHTSGDFFPIGTTQVDYTVTDAGGLQAQCSFTVEVLAPSDMFMLTIADETTTVGSQVCVPVTVTGFTDIMGMQFTIEYDPSLLGFVSVGNLNPDLPGFSPAANIGTPGGGLSPGFITVNWFDLFLAGVTLPDGAVLFELCFDALAPGVTNIDFTSSIAPIEITDNQQLVIPFNGEAGTITITDGGCPGLELLPDTISVDSSLFDCCWSFDFSNSSSQPVYGVSLTALDGVEFENVNIAGGFITPNVGNSHRLITPAGFGPMPSSAPGLASLCLSHVMATPQYVVVEYWDENYEPFCADTLVFNCPVEQSCLYLVSDSLACDTSGYKYFATVTNPPGAAFDVGYVKLNITSSHPGLFLPEPGLILADTLRPGDTAMVMWNLFSEGNFFGDSLCFILSAHDGVEERLCCAEIDTCIAFPNCYPCDYVDVTVAAAPMPGTGGGGDCLGGNPLYEPWLQALIADCANQPCGMEVYCCEFQGQPVVNIEDDKATCTDSGGAVYDYQGNLLFFYGGIAGINLNLYAQLENCALIFDCGQLDDCCYTLLVDNEHPDPAYFSDIQVSIITPGITFSAINFNLASGWIYDPLAPGQSSYLWSHNSGSVPALMNHPLFDFCLEGVTTTDSICIAVEWLQQDSVVCSEVVKVHCPDCVVVTADTITCDSNGVYTYSFSGQNWSEYEVNAIGFVETSADYQIGEEVIYLPGPLPPNGGAFGPVDIHITPAGVMVGDTLCFDIVLRQVVEDSINILCCYATHCIVLPPCEGLPPCDSLLCIAPQDVETECSELPFAGPYDIATLQSLFGVPEAGGSCPGATWQELPPQQNLDCGAGTIIRNFQAVDAAGNVSTNTCQQVVTIFQGPPNYAIRFPADTEAICGQPTPDSLILEEIGCELLAVTVDSAFFAPSGAECYRIARTIEVINWCRYDGVSPPVVVGRDEDCDGLQGDEAVWVLVRPNGVTYYDRDNDENNLNPLQSTKGTACDGLTNPDGHWVNSSVKPSITSAGRWQYTQFIAVYDDTPPAITPLFTGPFCVYDSISPNCTGVIDIPFEVEEACLLDQLLVRAFIDLGGDGSAEAGVEMDAFGNMSTILGAPGIITLSGAHPTYLINGQNIPIGGHSATIEVEDGCGNVSNLVIDFVVVDCGAPAPDCINGLALELQPVDPPMDVDGDGDLDNGAMAVFASDFILGPVTDCSGPVVLSINRGGEPPVQSQNVLLLTCDDLGTVTVEIHAWDAAGNRDNCETFIIVQDNLGSCGPAAEPLSLSPNPAAGQLWVESRRTGPAQLEILSLEGTVQRQQPALFSGAPVSVGLAGLPPGLYLLRVRYADGHTEVQRFVKM